MGIIGNNNLIERHLVLMGFKTIGSKYLTSLHREKAQQIEQKGSSNEVLSAWMTKYRMDLYQKGPNKINEGCEICCPMLSQKSIWWHLNSEQQRYWHNWRSTKHHLVIGRLISNDCKQNHNILAKAYKGTYNMVACFLIIECVKPVNVSKNIQLTQGLLSTWEIMSLWEVEIKSAIFQGVVFLH